MAETARVTQGSAKKLNHLSEDMIICNRYNIKSASAVSKNNLSPHVEILQMHYISPLASVPKLLSAIN